MNTRRRLEIRWQRLVDEGGTTCTRCAATGTAVELATARLATALAPLGLDVTLHSEVLEPSSFDANPLDSNRLWIAGTPLEQWLGATSGQSPCCSTCGGADCRTVQVDGAVYEAIPAELIVRAGLLAAASMLGSAPEPACCSGAEETGNPPSCCGS